jgi:hypothetical protein
MRVSLCYEFILLQRETKERERERERKTRKRHVGEAHSVLITAILLPQCLSCYWGKIVSANLRLADLRLTTAQQRSTGQNLPSDPYCRCPGMSALILNTDSFFNEQSWESAVFPTWNSYSHPSFSISLHLDQNSLCCLHNVQLTFKYPESIAINLRQFLP